MEEGATTSKPAVDRGSRARRGYRRVNISNPCLDPTTCQVCFLTSCVVCALRSRRLL